MTEESNVLFSPRPILEERLGADMFKKLPSVPGIYQFYDRYDRLLYVGKAKDLRKRLFTYKRAKAGTVSSKVARLIGQISRMEILEAESEQDALLLENHWIRKHKPPFNHVNKQTEAYYFIYLHPDSSGLNYRLSMRVHDGTDPKWWYGCFKGHAPVRRSIGCMLQLLWMAENSIYSPHHLPVQLTRRLTPMAWQLAWRKHSPSVGDNVPGMIRRWMLGSSCELLDWLMVQIDCGNHLTAFQTRFFEDRLHHLKSFYDRKLVRHNQIRGDRSLIGQNELDDLLVTSRPR